MTAKRRKGYIQPFIIRDGYEKMTAPAPGNLFSRTQRLGLAALRVITFPLRILFWGVLLPFVVVRSAYTLTLVAVGSVWTLIFRRSASAVVGLVRGVTGFGSHIPRRTAVAPSPRPVSESRGLPNSDNPVPKAVKPSPFARIRAINRVGPACLVAVKAGVIFPIRYAGISMRRAAGAVTASLLSGFRAFEGLLVWTFVRPAKIAFSIIARLPRSVNRLVRTTVLTISIEDAAVRMVVFRGRQVVAWKSAWIGDEFGPLAGSGSAEAGELRHQVTPALIKRVIQGAERGHGKIVVDLPAYTSLIRNLTLTKVGRRYLGPIVESELLESLPFGKNQVDLSWCSRPSTGLTDGQLEVFALAVPKAETERTTGLLVDSGISPSRAYAKSTALACAVGISNTLIIHFEDNMAAIVPVLQGEPKVVHKLTCPRDETSPETAYKALAQAVEQADEFSHGFEDAGDEEAGNPPAPVVLTGDIFGAGIDSQALAEVLQRPVSTLRTFINQPLNHPPDFPAGQYASNIGLFLAARTGIRPWETASHRTPSGHIPRNVPPALNVLPKRHMPPPLPVLPVLVFLALLLTAGGIVPFSGIVNAFVSDTNAVEDQLDFLQGQAKLRRSLVDQELKLAG